MSVRPLSSTLFPYTTLFRSALPPDAAVEILEAEAAELARIQPRQPGANLVWIARIRGEHQTEDVEIRDQPVAVEAAVVLAAADRKSTRLNSSHGYISYAGFC